MNNRKYIFIAVIIIILIAIIIGIYTIASSYLFEKGNGIPNTDSEIANRILSIKNDTERSNQIVFLLEQNILDHQEANELY